MVLYAVDTFRISDNKIISTHYYESQEIADLASERMHSKSREYRASKPHITTRSNILKEIKIC